MHEHHLTFSLVPPGHPGASRPAAVDNDGLEPLRRAMAEGELLRARLRQLQSCADCDPTPLGEAA